MCAPRQKFPRKLRAQDVPRRDCSLNFNIYSEGTCHIFVFAVCECCALCIGKCFGAMLWPLVLSSPPVSGHKSKCRAKRKHARHCARTWLFSKRNSLHALISRPFSSSPGLALPCRPQPASRRDIYIFRPKVQRMRNTTIKVAR